MTGSISISAPSRENVTARAKLVGESDGARAEYPFRPEKPGGDGEPAVPGLRPNKDPLPTP